ncbi:MAG: nucleoside hydrolase [Anaerolineae bacterium]|nr:nucleoside hydrolase [Anaerolineae bacterium]
MTRIILDVDTGTDDAAAIMFAALHTGLELVALTTVNGNVPLDYTTDNTLRIVDFLGLSAPVYAGMPAPLVRPNPTRRPESFPTPSVWGDTLDLPPAHSSPRPAHAVDFLIEYYMGPAGPETILVGLGPLTNIAAALKKQPHLTRRIPALYVMGGGHAAGNVDSAPGSEFNIWVDPHAAAVVFASGIERIALFPLDATHRACVTPADCDALEQAGTPVGQAAARFLRKRIHAYNMVQPLERPDTAPVHDALTVAAIVEPGLVQTEHLYVDVEVIPGLAFGRTMIDVLRRGNQRPNTQVALGADEAAFISLLRRVLGAAQQA